MAKSNRKQKKKKNPSKRTLRRRLLRFGAVFLLLYFVYSIVSIQIDIRNERQKLAAIDQQILEQRIQNDELARLLSDGNESEYIERIARERLGYAAPDERVFEDSTG